MAKDKTKTLMFTTRVTVNGIQHKFYFRRIKDQKRFGEMAKLLPNVSSAELDTVIYVYEDAVAAINTLTNYADRIVKV